MGFLHWQFSADSFGLALEKLIPTVRKMIGIKLIAFVVTYRTSGARKIGNR